MLQNLKANQKIDIKYPKLSRRLIFEFGRGNLPLDCSTLDLLIHLTPYIDLSGRVTVPQSTIRSGLNMRKERFQFAINQAIAFKYLSIDAEGELYTHFHSFIGEDVKGLDYVPTLEAFTSRTMRRYSLNTKRLFYYFVGSGRIGVWQNVKMTKLYRNKLHTDDTGVYYFHSFREAADSLIQLIIDGHLEIKLSKSNEDSLILSKDTVQVKAKLYAYFGVPLLDSPNTYTRKKRVTTPHNGITLLVRIPNEIKEQPITNSASEHELVLVGDKYGVAISELESQTRGFFIKNKNELFSLFGKLGVTIYRKALEKYFEKCGSEVCYYDQTGRAESHFKNFYLIPMIKEILISLAKHRNNHDLIHETPNVSIIWERLPIDFSIEKDLLTWIIERMAADQVITFVDDLRLEGCINLPTYYKELILLNNKIVETKYNALNLSESYIDKNTFEKHLIYLARENLLRQVTAYDSYINNLKTTLLQSSPVNRVCKVPFYNWLEERE